MKTKKVNAEFDSLMNKLNMLSFDLALSVNTLKSRHSDFSVSYDVNLCTEGLYLTIVVRYQDEIVVTYGCVNHMEIDAFSSWFSEKQLLLMKSKFDENQSTGELGKKLFNKIG